MDVIASLEMLRKGRVNVLLTSVGRRAYLVNYFKDVVGQQGKVIVTNSQRDVTGMIAADIRCVVPRAGEEKFIETLLGICRKHRVKLLMSLHDWEAPFIAAYLESFKELGTIAVVPNPNTTELCLDKWASYNFIRQMGWQTPVSFVSLDTAKGALESGLLEFPVVVKPRRGQGSIGVEVAHDVYELEAHHRLLVAKAVRMQSNRIMMQDGDEPLIIQQYIQGTEYDVEVVNDLQGRHISVLAKKKLSSRAGECELAETVEDPLLTDLGSDIGSKLGQPGVLDVDIIEQDGILYVLEFNPRFGGCYPFSHVAGANLPAAYVAWAMGVQPDPSWLHVKSGIKSFKDFMLVVDRR